MPQSPNVVGKSTDDKAASQRQMVPADLCLGGAPGRVSAPQGLQGKERQGTSQHGSGEKDSSAKPLNMISG